MRSTRNTHRSPAAARLLEYIDLQDLKLKFDFMIVIYLTLYY